MVENMVISALQALIFTKPIFDKYIKKNIEKTNLDMILGKTGTVTKEIKPDEFMIKLNKYINSKFDKLVVKR